MEEVIKQVYFELDRIHQVKKCTSCECLLDVIEAVQEDLSKVGTPQAKTAIEDMLKEGNERRHKCLGCEVCLPIAPYNRFSSLQADTTNADHLQDKKAQPASTCDCGSTWGSKIAQSEAAQKWPVVEGDYMVGDPLSAVSVCTLADTDLPAELEGTGILGNTAIVGTLSTENLGIERVIRNVVANPNIRFLVLCGRDSRGHRAGQAILSLKANGVDQSRRIVGALGLRPILKNITREELEAFRQHVTVVDEIATRDISRLTEVVKACLAQQEGSPPALQPKIHLPKTVEARRPSNKEFVHDPEGFFLVLLDRDTRAILCEHYVKEGILNEVIRGASAEDVANTAIKRGLISRLDHAAYLGRELAKAEAALVLELPYIQN